MHTKHLEIKTMFKMKNLLNEINGKLDNTEEKINEMDVKIDAI